MHAAFVGETACGRLERLAQCERRGEWLGAGRDRGEGEWGRLQTLNAVQFLEMTAKTRAGAVQGGVMQNRGLRTEQLRLLALALIWQAACSESRASAEDDRGVPGEPQSMTETEPAEGGGGSSGAAPSLDASATAPRDGGSLADAGGSVRPSDAGRDSSAADAEPDAMPPAMPGYVDFTVTTKPLGGAGWEPRNLLAIWVESASGSPVKVLARWAGIRAVALTEFRTTWSNVDNSFATSGSAILMDAITGATLPRHGTRTARWNLTDYEGNPVPDGTYSIVVESTDSLQTTAVTSVAFTKGSERVMLAQAETLQFGPITLTYVPGDAP